VLGEIEYKLRERMALT